jgi:hypothetical protein
MEAASQPLISLAALACSIVALFFSLLAAFPGLKVVLAVVRDGVLWCALFLVAGGVAFVAWQHIQQSSGGAKPADAIRSSTGQASGLP